jgi:hypothetical protein
MVQIDLGRGNSVWPKPRLCTYPALLGFPSPRVPAYPPEGVIAEKLEAMVVLGDRNSRIKDFFDLHHLASLFGFDRVTLAEAVRRAFARRHTTIPEDVPIGLTPAHWEKPLRPAQVRAFARRAGLSASDVPGVEFIHLLRAFLLPILDDVQRGKPREGRWKPGGPWEEAKG